MKASELIKQLVEVVADVGDQEVYLSAPGVCVPTDSVGGHLNIYVRAARDEADQ